MTKLIRRGIAIIMWLIASLLIWAIPCNLALFTIEYLERRGIHVPSIVETVYNVVAVLGCLLILPAIAVLGIRGKLPWTGKPPVVPRDSSEAG